MKKRITAAACALALTLGLSAPAQAMSVKTALIGVLSIRCHEVDSWVYYDSSWTVNPPVAVSAGVFYVEAYTRQGIMIFKTALKGNRYTVTARNDLASKALKLWKCPTAPSATGKQIENSGE